jgi:tetratricopeptide (TPR) repeat protein
MSFSLCYQQSDKPVRSGADVKHHNSHVGMAIALALASQAQAQPTHVGVPGDASADAVQAGDVSFANSGAPAAQTAFLSGLALLHDFEYERAAEAFRRAEAADSGFAMAYWGEAMTYNHAVWMEQDLAAGRAALAKLGPTPEARAAKAPTPRERDYLAAVEILYGEGTKEARDFRYADAMADLHAKYPDDVDATALYALSLLGTSHEGRDFATYMKSAALLEEVYPTHMRHPGVLHYMIHSYDDPIHAPLGLRAARRYGAVAPDAPHALHMTSHIFIALGMWDEVIAANQNAWRVGNALRAARGRSPTACGHGITWLTYGYLQEGRDAEAARIVAGCRVAAAAGLAAPRPAGADPDRSAVGSYVFMRLLQTVETGRREPAETLTLPAAGYEWPTFNDAYGEAVAALKANDGERLKAAATRLAALAPSVRAELTAEGNDRRADRESIEVMVGEMAAAAQIRAGDVEAGLAALRKAAQSESDMPMEFGPPAVALPAWELLGEELLRAGKPADAAAAFRNALARAPGRSRSLQGMARSADLAGDASAAAKARTELARYPRGGEAGR